MCVNIIILNHKAHRAMIVVDGQWLEKRIMKNQILLFHDL